MQNTFQCLLALLIAGFSACSDHEATVLPAHAGVAPHPRVRTLTLGAYSSVQDVYGNAILPAFRSQWQQQNGEDVRFVESYKASGAQARAILGGFEADVAALSLEPDLETIVADGFVHHDWRSAPHRGIVTRSLVAIGVRAGNPKHIGDWKDLAQDDVDLLMPNVRSSGGAMWYVLAILGAGERGRIEGDELPTMFLGRILAHVRSFDKGTRDSVQRFEAGEGDAVLTYESEVLAAQRRGVSCDYVVPRSTILVENPVAVVDRWADKHANQDLAQAFVAFLFTPEAQVLFAQDGSRPVDERVVRKATQHRLQPSDLFTIEDLGGWEKTRVRVFGSGGAYDQAQGSRTPLH